MTMQPLRASSTKPLLGGPSFSLGNRAYRAIWAMSWWVLAAWTPPPLHAWRLFLLRVFGATVHSTARVYGSARIWFPPNLVLHENAVLGPRVDCYCMASIEIRARSVVSQGARLCCGSHDINDPDFQLIASPIVIGRDAWVAAEAFVGPGVTVNEGAVIGARAVIFKDAEAFGVYAGNPAKLIKHRDIDR
jgi:putative colanic acid biosynthesis acetyltransferase WcaF